jgi:hypothetical protein
MVAGDGGGSRSVRKEQAELVHAGTTVETMNDGGIERNL